PRSAPGAVRPASRLRPEHVLAIALRRARRGDRTRAYFERVITQLTLAEVADAFASVTAEAFNLPAGDVPAPQGERLVAIMNDWLATRNWRLAYVRDP